MASLFRLYKSCQYIGWIHCSNIVAVAAGKGPWLAHRLWVWCSEFVCDFKKLPTAEYGKKNTSVLEDEDHAQELHLHLQGKGAFVSAQDVIDYVNMPEVQQRWRLKKGISTWTAQRWMNRMSYRWKKTPKGMYADGHEHEDVVDYQQNTFLPQWEQSHRHARKWDKNGEEDTKVPVTGPDGKVTVIWRHDESTFYANDRRQLRWVHSSEHAKPYVKGKC
ncbi:hypothetical protein GGU11DRAFT_693328 [Lentinula aff. detonsa]|nr:hypothetical protein GGU11DRAFT_693328 [Lentinula aff. detonsa]